MTVPEELPTVSVIICCRNSASTLAVTLDAVAAQEYEGWWEVVVVDNGSSDPTIAVAERFATKLPNLSVLPNPKPGYQASALNYGISKAKGEALVFLDSDDVVGRDYILHMAEAMRTSAYVGARMDIDMLNPVEVRGRRTRLQEKRIDIYCGFLPAVVGAAMGGRKEAMELVGGFDEALPTQHDLDISWRLLAEGVSATFVPDAVLHYRYRTSPREIFSQERGYGDGEVVLFRKFRSAGMPRRSRLQVAAAYIRTIVAAFGAFHPEGQARFATLVGMNLGRLEGSARHRTAYL